MLNYVIEAALFALMGFLLYAGGVGVTQQPLIYFSILGVVIAIGFNARFIE